MPGIEHRHVVRQPRDQRQAVRDEQDRACEAVAQRFEQRHDLRLDGHVERGRRLVRDQEIRLAEQRHGDQDALAHAARQLMRIGGQPARRIGDANLSQHVDPARQQLAAAHVRKPGALGIDELGPDRKDRVQGRHRVLEHHGEPASAQRRALGYRQGQQIDAVQKQPALKRRIVRQQPHQGERQARFTAAALADQAEDAALFEAERNPVEASPPAVKQAEPPQFQQRRAHGAPRRSSASRSASPNKVKPSVASPSTETAPPTGHRLRPIVL